MKTNRIYYFVALLTLQLLSGCRKDGEFAVKSIKALKPFSISGYVVGDTLEQYFDGVRVRDYYGKVELRYAAPSMAFENETTLMQFKNKRTGELVYEQKFSIKDETNVVPNFYFDGKKLSRTFPVPTPQGNEYLINFFIDGPQGMPEVDIALEVLEYYYENNKLKVVNTTTFPIAGHIRPGSWTEYKHIPLLPEIVPVQSGTSLYPAITIKESKSGKYLINNQADFSLINAELPNEWTTLGKVQSFHIQKKPGAAKDFYLESYDLVQLFPN